MQQLRGARRPLVVNVVNVMAECGQCQIRGVNQTRKRKTIDLPPRFEHQNNNNS